MTLSELSPSDIDRPAFQNLDVDSEFHHPNLSKLALVAFGLGMLSLITLLAQAMIVVSILAAAVGCVALWRISRDEHLGGALLAQIGLALGILTAVWSVVAANGQEDYIYSQAGENAEYFLEVLAAGRKYDALELTQIEPDRQITGTDLRQYYDSLTGELEDMASSFINSPGANLVLSSGPNAKWTFRRGISVSGERTSLDIIVELENTATEPATPIRVRIHRATGFMAAGDDGLQTANWNVVELLPLN